MPSISSVGNPPLGFEPEYRTCRGIPRGASATKGQLWKFDLEQSDGDVSNAAIGDTNSCFANLVQPDAVGVESGVFAVAAEDITEDRAGTWILSGVCQALVQKGSGNIAIGNPLMATASQNYLDADVTAGGIHLAKALEAVTGPSTATLAKVWFDGTIGFGVHVS